MSESIFTSEFDLPPVVRRREMLPWWIKFFTWCFLLGGVLAPIILVLGFFGTTATLGLYGLETREPLSTTGLAVIALLSIKGVAAYGLWMEKNWGIIVAIGDALLGIVVCVAMMFVLKNVRLELIVLVLYLIKLFKIKKQW